jgi:hypothetical protein
MQTGTRNNSAHSSDAPAIESLLPYLCNEPFEQLRIQHLLPSVQALYVRLLSIESFGGNGLPAAQKEGEAGTEQGSAAKQEKISIRIMDRPSLLKRTCLFSVCFLTSFLHFLPQPT